MSSGLHALLERKKPSKWSLFLSNPVIFLAQKFYSRRGKVELELSLPVTTVVCISDTHNRQFDIPEGDILLHAGDLTQSGSKSEIQAAVDWLNALPHNHKVVIARNHDLLLAQERSRANRGGSTVGEIEWGSVIYLKDSSTTLILGDRKLRIYGSPRSPCSWNWASQYPRANDVWRGTIPPDTDIC